MQVTIVILLKNTFFCFLMKKKSQFWVIHMQITRQFCNLDAIKKYSCNFSSGNIGFLISLHYGAWGQIFSSEVLILALKSVMITHLAHTHALLQ
jgi:hypothetical protein